MPELVARAPLPPKFFAHVVVPSAAASFSAKASVLPILVSAGVVRLAVSKYPLR